MPLIQIPASVQACQVDVPDTLEHRSTPGALHLRPGVKRLTQDEWGHLQQVRPDVAKKCHVVPVDENKTKGAQLKAEEAKKAEAARPKPKPTAKDKPTKRQRRLAGEADAKAKPPQPKAQPPKAEAEAMPKEADKGSKDKGDKKSSK